MSNKYSSKEWVSRQTPLVRINKNIFPGGGREIMSLDCLFQAPKNCVNQLADLKKEEKHTSEDGLRMDGS